MAALVMLLAAGCSSQTESGQPDGDSGNAENAAAVPTTTETSSATIEQFGSIIAEHKGDWDEQVATTKENCLDPATVARAGLDTFWRIQRAPPKAVNPAVEAFQQAGCVDPLDTACLVEYMAMDSAVDELSRKLDAWTAY